MSTSTQQSPANQYHSVHASAGSGKTYHLVTHMVRLLILGAEPASILAITFTRKAAAEMQQRLLERVFELAIASDAELDSLLEDSFSLTANDTHRTQAKNLYESLLHTNLGVRTTTFHSFCQDLLRRFPMEADIPPGFELVERIGYLIDEAWNNLENEFTRNPALPVVKHFDVLLTQLGTTKTRSELDKFIAARSEWWALSSQADFSIEQHCEKLAKKLGIITSEDPVKNYFDNKETQDNLREYLRLLPLAKVKDHEKCACLIDDGLNNQDEVAPRLAKIWSGFFTDKDKPRSRKESDALKKRLGDSDYETFLHLHETQCDKLIKVRQQIHAMETLSLTHAWLHAGKAFVDRYQTIKHNHRNLDFSDLEWQCYCLLNSSDHADWIQYKLDQRIDHLLVDEFQDTNQTQWQLILPLLKELAAATQERQRSVLFVGDSKQSIYRFRRAEPKLFDTASHWIEKNLGADKQYLSLSWRSSPAVIDFVNRLFDSDGSIPLNDFQTHKTVKTKLSGTVELLPLSVQENKKTKELAELRNPLKNPLISVDSEHLIEAEVAAAKISEIINSKLIINQGDATRYIDYGDIMILLRNRNHATDFERALREAHIPYTGTEKGTLLESLEIKDMVNLLQWLITPFDNHALAGVLRSPLFSATEQDLYPLVHHGNWFKKILEQYTGLSENASTENTPLVRAAFHLQNWMAQTDTLPVHDLLDRIYSEGNVLERYKANYPGHLQSRVQANLTRFIELALENDSGRYPSLTRFLAWLRLLKQQDREAPDQPASGSDRNRVKILTIHESKGLESPVVLLLDATTTPRNKGGASVLIDWPLNQKGNNETPGHPVDFLISPSAPYPNAHCEALKNTESEKDSQEEANLLYVAITRAQQYLYISGSGKSKGWYEHICQRYEISDEMSAETQTPEKCVLETHIGEKNKLAKKTIVPATPIQTEIQFNPRLQQPIKLVNSQIDISPSKTGPGQKQTERQTGEQTRATSDNNNKHILDARERGILIHQMIEALSQQPDLSLNDFCRKHQINAQLEYLTDYWKQAERTISRFPEYFIDDHYQAAYSEVPVYYKKEDAIVNGIIDRLIVNKDEIIILDYKTQPLENDKNLDAIASQFRSQLSFYKEGVALLYPGHSIKTCVIFTSLPACIEVFPD